MSKYINKNSTFLFILFIGFILYYLIPVEYRALWQPDEVRYAEISREMLASGNWTVPHFLDLRYFEKPVMGYWINNIGQFIFGHNNFAVRAGAIFSTTITALLVTWLSFAIWRDKRTSLYAVMIFLTCFIVYSVGSYAVLDPMISMWLTAAMCFLWLALQAKTTRGKILGFILTGIACGLGVMTKGFLALAVPVVSILPWVINEKRWKDLLLFGPLAVISAMLTLLPWALNIASKESDFWHYFFWVEHVQRFAQSDAQHKAPFWYYLPIVLAGSLPWLGLLPGALRLGWRGRRHCQHAFYLLCWVVMPILLFSIAKGKLLTYILPCFAPLAILLARYASQARRGIVLNGWINVLLGLTAMLIIWLVLSPWGISKNPLYQEYEITAIASAMLAFAFWVIIGLLSLKRCQHGWKLAALCPLGVALLIGVAIPYQIIDSKQPQSFIHAIRQPVSNSRYILVNQPGIASAVAWELRRSDIILLNYAGELQYGLSYPDATDKLVSNADFPQWLARHRQHGAISVILLRPRNDDNCAQNMPKPDYLFCRGRLIFMQYQPLAAPAGDESLQESTPPYSHQQQPAE